MDDLKTTLLIIGIIVGILAIIVFLYMIAAQRRKSITLKKIDYLVEDITHKSELLTSTVETVAKVANYVDVFEIFTRKNIKSVARVISRNKDDIYKIGERIKKMLMGQEETKKKGGK